MGSQDGHSLLPDYTVFVTDGVWHPLVSNLPVTEDRQSRDLTQDVHACGALETLLFIDTLLAWYKGRLDYVQIFLFLYWFIKKREKYEKRGKFFISLLHINVC